MKLQYKQNNLTHLVTSEVAHISMLLVRLQLWTFVHRKFFKSEKFTTQVQRGRWKVRRGLTLKETSKTTGCVEEKTYNKIGKFQFNIV